MRTPPSLERARQRLAAVEAHIEALQARLAELRQRHPVARPDELERSLALLIDLQQVLRACTEDLERGPVPASPQGEAPPQGGAPRDEFGSAEVSIGDPESVRHWCSVFGCNEAELVQAVWKAGSRASAVDAYLADRTERARGARKP